MFDNDEIKYLFFSEMHRKSEKTGQEFIMMEKQYEGYYWYETEGR